MLRLIISFVLSYIIPRFEEANERYRSATDAANQKEHRKFNAIFGNEGGRVRTFYGIRPSRVSNITCSQNFVDKTFNVESLNNTPFVTVLSVDEVLAMFDHYAKTGCTIRLANDYCDIDKIIAFFNMLPGFNAAMSELWKTTNAKFSTEFVVQSRRGKFVAYLCVNITIGKIKFHFDCQLPPEKLVDELQRYIMYEF